MQYEHVQWADLGEEERRQALTFVPEVLAAPLHAPFKLCVLKEEEEDGEAFDLGESNLSWFEHDLL